MVTFKIEEHTLHCTFPMEIEFGRFKKSYTIVSHFDAFNVYRSVFEKCADTESTLSRAEELILWTQLKDICESYHLPWFTDRDLKSVHAYLAGSRTQHISTQQARVRGFLKKVEEEIRYDLRKEQNRTLKSNAGEPAPYSKKHSKAHIPKESA